MSSLKLFNIKNKLLRHKNSRTIEVYIYVSNKSIGNITNPLDSLQRYLRHYNYLQIEIFSMYPVENKRVR